MKFFELFMISLSAEAAHYASTPAKTMLRGVGERYLLREGVRGALDSYVKKRIISDFTRRGIEVVLRDGMSHILGGMVGAAAFTATQHVVMATVGLKPWLMVDKKKNGWSNFWMNFGEEFMVGSAIFIFAPLVQQGVFQPLGRRMAGFANPGAVQDYIAQQGMNAKGRFYHHALDGKSLILAGTRISGDTLVFASIPFIDRAVRSQIYPDDHDPVFGESEEKSSIWNWRNGRDIGEAFKISLWFYLTSAMKQDAERMRYTGSAARRHGVFAFKLVTFTPDATMWNSMKQKSTLLSGELRDHYQDLGVSSMATPEEIHQAFRKVASENHPDRAKGSVEAYQAAVDAKDVLLNPLKRATYDLLREGLNLDHGKTGEEGAFANVSEKFSRLKSQNDRLIKYIETVENAQFDGRFAGIRRRLNYLKEFYKNVLSGEGVESDGDASTTAPSSKDVKGTQGLEYHPKPQQ
jgi:hypothetical protein